MSRWANDTNWHNFPNHKWAEQVSLVRNSKSVHLPSVWLEEKKKAHLHKQVGQVDNNFLGENKSEEHRLNLSGS